MAAACFLLRHISLSAEQCAVLVGDCEELGEWRPESGLQLVPVEEGVWKAEVSFADSSLTVNYKYVVCRKGSSTELLDHKWEGGENRTVHVEDRTNIDDSWSNRGERRVWKEKNVEEDEAGSVTNAINDSAQRKSHEHMHAVNDALALKEKHSPAGGGACGTSEEPTGSSRLMPDKMVGKIETCSDSIAEGGVSAVTDGDDRQPERSENTPEKPAELLQATNPTATPRFLSDRAKLWTFSKTPGKVPEESTACHMFFASDDDFVSHAFKWLAGGLHWFVGEAVANPPHHLNFIEGAKGARLRADAFKSSDPDEAVHSPCALLGYLSKEKAAYLKPAAVLQAHSKLLGLALHGHNGKTQPESVISDAKALLNHLKSVTYKNAHHISESVEHALTCAAENMASLDDLYRSMKRCRERSGELKTLPLNEKKAIASDCLRRCLEHLAEDDVINVVLDTLVCRLQV